MAKTLVEQEDLAKKYNARFVCMKLTQSKQEWEVVMITNYEDFAVTWFDKQTEFTRIYRNDNLRPLLFYAK